MAKQQINDPGERDRHVPATDFADSDLPPLDGATDELSDDVEELPDGSAVVKFKEDVPKKTQGGGDFLENLADGVIDDPWLAQLAVRMLDNFERDKDARKKRDEQYADGIKRTGLGNEAPGGADFDGASRAVHPVLLEGCIEFAARSMKELFPPSGPVKTAIVGEQTDAKLDKAERKKEYMNWQLTKQIKEYRPELEQTLTQVPLGGSQFLKVWHDERYMRPRVEFVPVDYILLPAAAADFDTAERKTHMQDITKQEFQARVASGLYREPEAGIGTTAMLPERTAADKASNKVEGVEEDALNEDGLRRVYECYIMLDVPDDPLGGKEDSPRPYILTIDETTRSVVALYRNWDEEDKKPFPDELAWMVEFGFIPWRGAYKIGLAHIIGGMSGALTGALRSLLDGGFLQSHAGGLVLKGSRTTGKNIQSSPTEFTELSAPPNVDDIRKLAMPFPFPGPSETIFKVMDWLTQQARGVVSTASEAIKDAGSDMPVGTALALIEQGSITFSAVHARLHNSQRRFLEILHRINGHWLDDEVTVEELGELVVGRKDFQGPMDVMPVSDPNIFSDAQRYAQNQAAMAMAEKFPMVFKLDKLVSRALKLMNYPQADEVLNAPAPAKVLGAVEENTQASQPEVQLKAYRSQDHMAHIQAHIHFMVSPIFCANPMMAMPALPKLLAHVKEHLLALYQEHAKAAGAVASVIQKAGGPLKGDSVVTGAEFAERELVKQLAEMMPHLEQAEKLAQKFAPPPPMDPRAQATMQVAKIKVEADAAEGDKDRQVKVGELQADSQKAAAEQAAETARASQEMQVAAHNADLAAMSENMERNLSLALEHIRQDGDNARAEFGANVELLMAEIKAGREDDRVGMQQDFDQLQQRSDRIYDLFSQYMEHKANLGEPVKQTILGKAAEYATQPSEPTPLTLSAPPAAAPAPVAQGFAHGGLVEQPKSAPKGWRVVRDANGDMTHVERMD